jgi:hypothetical protein
MIISFSHELQWTDSGPQPTQHKPFFLIKDNGTEIPKLDKVTEISEPFEMLSWVNWKQKIKVRKIYLQHPSVTPRVSTEYYRLGYETYEMSVPYLTRIAADKEANGEWPFNTNNEWVSLNCLIYDIENPDGIMKCIGLGEFTIRIRSSYNLKTEDFELEVEVPDECTITQITAETREEEQNNILDPLVEAMRKAHIIIGHNITGYDNERLLEKLKLYNEYDEFIKQRFYNHRGFFRGREQPVTEIYPLSFDTLLVARQIWKDESEVGYGLKNLAVKYKLSPSDRVYERDFEGFGKWSNSNPKCLKYNKDDITETFGLFKLQFKTILTTMFITGLSFQDAVSGSNGKMADHMCLVRGYNYKINPPMMHPSRIAEGLELHFKGKLKTKREIFDYFRNHECSWECIKGEAPLMEEDDEENVKSTMTPDKMNEKLVRVTKYGKEMPDFCTYYPLLTGKIIRPGKSYIGYVSVGGMTLDPAEPLMPSHEIMKADTAAQYPTILKAANIVSDSVRLARKGETPTGWCWFRDIAHKNILELFEWKPASEFSYSDGEGYFIGYVESGEEGLLNKSLTSIIKAVGKYKKMPGWEDAYQRSLKPMRNAMTHGVMLALQATCQEFNIAGCAIPTYGQVITDYMNNYLIENGWKLVYVDTDGSEFRKIKEDAKDFQQLVHEIEKYWSDRFKYPVVFDVEHYDHKCYISHKNYISIEKGKVKLTGNTLHGSDKLKIAERCLKKVALQYIPITNTKEELLSNIIANSLKIVNEEFKNVNINDLTIIEGVAPSNTYDNPQYAERTIALETLLDRKITFPTKFEFIVCLERLPNTTGTKSKTDPISFMWPKDYVIEHPDQCHVDYDWAKDNVFAHLDTVFDFHNISSKFGVKSIFSFDPSSEEQNINTGKKVLSKLSEYETGEEVASVNVRKQNKLF